MTVIRAAAVEGRLMLVTVLVVLGLRTWKNPGVPASAAFASFVAQRAVPVVVLPSGKTETEECRHVYRIRGTVVGLRAQVQGRVRACVGDNDGVEQKTDAFVKSRTKEYSEYTGVVCCWY